MYIIEDKNIEILDIRFFVMILKNSPFILIHNLYLILR